MSKKMHLISIIGILLIFIVACSSNDTISGSAIEENVKIDELLKLIDEESKSIEIKNDAAEVKSSDAIIQDEVENESREIIINETIPNVSIEVEIKREKFNFSPESIVNTQNNVSLSIDNIEHEIKSEYWGKITEITSTIMNNGYKEFKPKVIVLLYDEEDFKEEWFKPKAEIDFDVEKLGKGEHTTKQAIVNIAFDDINLTKNFRVVLTDAADKTNSVIVVVETEFKPK